MKVKVSEATGVVLDWMVAKCEGFIGADGKYTDEYCDSLRHDQDGGFSTDWALGGPIIEREKISIRQWTNVPIVHAYMPEGEWSSDGESPLIAAMRCFVISKLGEEVEVPDELS